jgi:hypothetical protein
MCPKRPISYSEYERFTTTNRLCVLVFGLITNKKYYFDTKSLFPLPREISTSALYCDILLKPLMIEK